MTMSPQHEQAIVGKAIKEAFKYGLKAEDPIVDADVAKISSEVYKVINQQFDKKENTWYNALDTSYFISTNGDAIRQAATFAFQNRDNPRKVEQEFMLRQTPLSEISYKDGALAKKLLEQAAFIIGANNPGMDLEQKAGKSILQADVKNFLDQFPDKMSSSIRMTLNRQEAADIMVKSAQSGQWYRDKMIKEGQDSSKNILGGVFKRLGLLKKGVDSAESLNKLNETGLGQGKFATMDRSSHFDIGLAAIKHSSEVGI